MSASPAEPTPEAARRGTWLVAATISAGAVEPLLARAGMQHDVRPETLLVARYVVAALVVLLTTRQLRRVPMRAAAELIAAGVLLFITSGLALVAFARLPIAVAVTLVSVTPLWVALASFRREQLGGRFFAALALGFVGIALTAGPMTGDLDGAGLGCALGATGSSAIYRLLVERLGRAHPTGLVSSYAYATGAVLALGIAPFVPPFSMLAWGSGVAAGLSAAISNITFVAAVAALGAARTSLALLLQRPVVIALAALLLGEPVGLVEGLGVSLVIAAVWLARKPAPKKKEGA